MNRRNLVRALWIGAMLAVLVATLAPVPQVPDLPANTDKLVHLACYLMLGTLAALAQHSIRSSAAAACAMLIFGVAIEIVQGQLPWRSFEWADIAANIAGVLLGAGAVLTVRWRAVTA
jgi:VanZ family protein